MTSLVEKSVSFYGEWIKSGSKSETIVRIACGFLFLIIGISLFNELWHHSYLSHLSVGIVMLAYVCIMTYITWLLGVTAYTIMKYGK